MATRWTSTSILSLSVLIAGSAVASLLDPSSVPASLRPPPTNTLYLKAGATGVQIYECSRKPDATYEWAFKAPEATLSDGNGRLLGKHYAGPAWEALDGSTVAGAVTAKEAGPDATAIPWLLLAAKSNFGKGTFAATKFVQRVATVGGLAPSEACSEATLKQQARVPYSATYLFYR